MASRLTFTGGKRHTYKLDGQRVPSVTTLLGILDKPGLVPWASRITARYAADHWDSLTAMDAEERFEMLKGTAERVRNTSAAKGTQIHSWAELLLKGEPVDIPAEYVESVEGFAAYWAGSGFHSVGTEIRCFSDADLWAGCAYAGTFDLYATDSHGSAWLLDHKTGAGIYPTMGLQLAAYGSAEYWVDTVSAPEGTDLPAPHIDRYGILHIRPDGTTLHELINLPSALDRFSLLRMYASTDEPEFKEGV